MDGEHINTVTSVSNMKGMGKRKKHGTGIFTLGDGSSYEGDFHEGEIHGVDWRRWPDGSTYSGQFRLGEMDGEGTYVGSTGEKYEGSMKTTKRQGEGELTKTNGDATRENSTKIVAKWGRHRVPCYRRSLCRRIFEWFKTWRRLHVIFGPTKVQWYLGRGGKKMAR